MANIKKTFNFRNGVQVDDDNLIVNATGLVGIGTTIPTEALDVRGTAKIVGLVSATSANIGILTVTTVDITGQQTITGGLVGSGVSIKSGVITATDPTGIVTFYGDARYLQGMPTSQWLDKDVGLGYSSIYNAGGNVGIHTNDPRYGLQIGGNNDIGNFAEGVGINTTGSIFATGIITATSFVGAIAGPVTGNVVGNVTGNLNSTGVSTIGSLKITNINITGLSTHRVPFTDATDNIVDSDDLTFNNNSNVLNIVGTTDTDQLNVSGVSTVSDDVNFIGAASTIQFDKSDNSLDFNDNARIRLGNSSDIQIYHNSSDSYSYISNSNAQPLRITGALTQIRNVADNANIADFHETLGVQLYYTGTKRLVTSGIGVTIYNQLDTTNIVASGVITATTELNSPLVGVGTADPQTDIQVRKPNAAQIRVSSDTDAAVVSVGREPGAGNANNAFIRYGNTSNGYPYSPPTSLDIVNNAPGGINFYLSANNAGAAIGDFHWHKGPNSARLMTLTKGGSLGIGITLPTERLHVSGGSSITGTTWFGANVNVQGNLNLTGNLNIPAGLSADINGDLTGNVLAKHRGNTALGIVTTNYLNVTGVSTIATSLAVSNTDDIGTNKFVVASGAQQFFVTAAGNVGVHTDQIDTGIEFKVEGDGLFTQSVGIGTTQPRCAVDFSDAVSVRGSNRERIAYMLPPRLLTSERNALNNATNTGLEAGAIIYNKDTNKHQGYNGTSWNDLY